MLCEGLCHRRGSLKFLNPYIKIHDGLRLRWSELSANKGLFLERLWNKGTTVECLCNGPDKPVVMGVGKRNVDFYMFNKDSLDHQEQCPCKHLGKKGEFYKKNSLGMMHKVLESTLIQMGVNFWSPNFERARNKFLFRKKFTDSFAEGLLFYPEFGEEHQEKNIIEINSLPELSGGEFYVAGFVYEFHIEDGNKGSFFKLKGFDKKFFMDGDIGALMRSKDKNFDFFALFKFIVLTSGKYVAVDASGIYIHKKTLTPHYNKDKDINSGRVFKSTLNYAKQEPEKEHV